MQVGDLLQELDYFA